MSTVRTFLVCLVLAGFAGRALPAQASQPPPTTTSGVARVFYGNIRTMDDENTVATAVAVDARGIIIYVGTALGAEKAAGAGFEKVPLEAGQTLLPGFIDAHMHVTALLQQTTGIIPTVGACPPKAYTPNPRPPRLPDPCYPYIEDALKALKPPAELATGSAFISAMFLDPSRQPYDPADVNPEAMKFKRCPSKYIEENISAERPVLIVDQSGHFGYVNKAAFVVLEAAMKAKGKAWPPHLPDGGEWNVQGDETPSPCEGTSLYGGEHGYTGLLTEPPAYAPFYELVMDDLQKNPPANAARRETEGVVNLLDDLRRVGLTTIVSLSETMEMLDQTRKLAELTGSGTRMLSVVPPGLATKKCKENTEVCQPAIPKPIPPRFDELGRLGRDLGVNGIKTMADGSTQGCTAGLSKTSPKPPKPPEPHYLTKDEKGECAPPEGRMNYTAEQLTELLRPLWETGLWRFETHANGNRAIQMTLGIYAQLQREGMDKKGTNSHTATIIHATVGDEFTWKMAEDLNKGYFEITPHNRLKLPRVKLHLSHLIGHVAYWGTVFIRQIGEEAAGKIDPILLDRNAEIPFSLHSDSPVSVPNPLWYIRQAVTRDTWTYPQFPANYIWLDKNKQQPNNDTPAVLGPLGKDERPEYAATVLEALRAVTINAAREKELDKWIGSIEVGKVADFVVLSHDLVDKEDFTQLKKDLADVKVVDTYLGGQITGKK